MQKITNYPIPCFRAIESVSHTVNGAQGIVNANLIAKLVEKLKTETDEIKVLQGGSLVILTFSQISLTGRTELIV